MAMQLTEDAPAMLALFACGVVGYLAAKRLRQPARIPKQAKKIDDEFDEGDLDAAQPAKPVARGTFAADGDSCGDQDAPDGRAPAAAARRSPKSRRRTRRQQGAAQASVEEAGAVLALDSVEDAGLWEEVTPPVSERVAKLLAKKAARKAKKAQEGLQQQVQEGKPGAEDVPEATLLNLQDEVCSEAPAKQDLEQAVGEDVPSEENQAVRVEGRTEKQDQQQAQLVESEEHWLQRLGEQQQPADQDERQELECQQQCEAEEQTDPAEAEHETAASADEQEKWEEEELEGEWDEEELEEEWEEEEMEEDQELPWQWRDQDPQQRGPFGRVDSAEWETELSEGSEEWPAEDAPTPPSANSGSWRSWSPSPTWKWRKSYWQEEQQQQQDGWMVPFDELITSQQQPALTGPPVCPVCICEGEEGTFTDGSQIFQPLQSSDGSQLFTDGDQVFMPVCVVMGSPPAEEAAMGFPGLSAAPAFEKVEEGEAPPTFDPYNPLGFAAPQQAPESADVWDTCWG